MKRTFAVGDVHGCDVALDTLMDALELTSEDHLILLGDVIDRGPDSRRVVQTLMDTSRFCRLDLILGNHEQMLLDALQSPAVAQIWFGWGGAETILSYGHDLADVSEEHIDYLAAAKPYVETEAAICVHANLEPGVPLPEQSIEWLRWQKITGRELPHESGKRIVCGHTQMPGDVPGVLDGWLMIDTGAYGGGFLTAVDLDSGEILQARQSGAFRRGVYIDELH